LEEVLAEIPVETVRVVSASSIATTPD